MIDPYGALEVFVDGEWRPAELVLARNFEVMPIVIVDVPGYCKNLFFYPGDGSFAGYFLGCRVSIDFVPANKDDEFKLRQGSKKFRYEIKLINDYSQVTVEAHSMQESRKKVAKMYEDKEWWLIRLIGEEK